MARIMYRNERETTGNTSKAKYRSFFSFLTEPRMNAQSEGRTLCPLNRARVKKQKAELLNFLRQIQRAAIKD